MIDLIDVFEGRPVVFALVTYERPDGTLDTASFSVSGRPISELMEKQRAVLKMLAEQIALQSAVLQSMEQSLALKAKYATAKLVGEDE